MPFAGESSPLGLLRASQNSRFLQGSVVDSFISADTTTGPGLARDSGEAIRSRLEARSAGPIVVRT
jgi:hypothetical protein